VKRWEHSNTSTTESIALISVEYIYILHSLLCSYKLDDGQPYKKMLLRTPLLA